MHAETLFNMKNTLFNMKYKSIICAYEQNCKKKGWEGVHVLESD